MNRWSKNIVVGVITSFFVTPLLGGAVVGYLNGPEKRELVRSGMVVGGITGLILTSLATLLIYLGGGFRSLVLLVNYLGFVGVVVFGSIVLAMIGAVIGNAIASRYQPRGEGGASI